MARGDDVDRIVGLFGAANTRIELQRHLLRDEEADNAVLRDLATPILFVQGTRDEMAECFKSEEPISFDQFIALIQSIGGGKSSAHSHLYCIDADGGGYPGADLCGAEAVARAQALVPLRPRLDVISELLPATAAPPPPARSAGFPFGPRRQKSFL